MGNTCRTWTSLLRKHTHKNDDFISCRELETSVSNAAVAVDAPQKKRLSICRLTYRSLFALKEGEGRVRSGRCLVLFGLGLPTGASALLTCLEGVRSVVGAFVRRGAGVVTV